MKKTLKGITITFFIFSLVFSIAWLAVFFLHGLLAADINMRLPYFNYYWVLPRFKLLPEFLSGAEYGFAPANDKIIKVFDKRMYAYIFTFIGYALLLIMLAVMVVGIIFSIKRKRKRYIFYIFVMLLALMAVLDFVIYLGPYYGEHFKFVFHDYNEAGNVIFTLLSFALALLAYIFTIIEVFVGLARAKRLLKAKQEVEVPSKEAPKEKDITIQK